MIRKKKGRYAKNMLNNRGEWAAVEKRVRGERPIVLYV